MEGSCNGTTILGAKRISLAAALRKDTEVAEVKPGLLLGN